MKGVRRERLGDMIRQEIASSLIHTVKDPRIQGFITVTKVEMTADLKLAHVYISIFGGGHDPHKILQGLKNAAGFLKAQIGKSVNLRYIPDLKFELDTSLDYGDRIDQLLKKTKQS